MKVQTMWHGCTQGEAGGGGKLGTTSQTGSWEFRILKDFRLRGEPFRWFLSLELRYATSCWTLQLRHPLWFQLNISKSEPIIFFISFQTCLSCILPQMVAPPFTHSTTQLGNQLWFHPVCVSSVIILFLTIFSGEEIQFHRLAWSKGHTGEPLRKSYWEIPCSQSMGNILHR